jgi:membrane protein
MKIYGMNINKKVSVMILFIFILCSTVALADASSDAFAQVFREASGSGNNVIERVVDALYYGLLIMYRGVSVKVSQLCGLFLVFFMTLDILTVILKNIAQKAELYSLFKMMIPRFVKNLIIAFILVTPTYYSLKIGVGGGATALKMKGTLVTRITEMFFDMFYRLGALFFNDPGMARATPGRIAMAFFNRPIEMLKDIFGFMVFFAIFTNLAKVILLLFCLWLSGKIIAVYVSNIFTALILTTCSVFYLMFLTMESTAQIGQKGIQMIVQQSMTLFMTVAMMGISYQVINLVAAGNSIQAIAALAVVLLMLSQVMENIGMMAIAVTTGSGLGISSDSAFMGLAQAAGMAISGLAMFGGAKLDELTNRKDGGKNNNSSYKGGDNKNNDAFRKALQNVGRPETDGNNAYGRTRAGVAFKKNAANARNMNDADSSMRNSAKKRHGMGVMSAKLFSAMVGGMTTSSLYDFDVLKGVGSEFKDVFSDKDFEGKDSSYPYSQEYYEDMRDKGKMMLSRAWDNAIDSVRGVNLDGSSGSEAVRQARMNIGNMIKAPKKVEIGNDN